MISYPSIEHFANLYKSVEYQTRYSKSEDGIAVYNEVPLPVITFIGTVKSHGSQGSIVYTRKSHNLVAQSRNRVLNLQHDNMEFCAYVMKHQKIFKQLLMTLSELREIVPYQVAIFGEWCGSGIQKGVAVSQLPKMFLPFAAKIIANGMHHWITARELSIDFINIGNEIDYQLFKNLDSIRCFPIADFGIYPITIDFNDPKPAQEKINSWVQQIDQECPIGNRFGVSDHGEGLVFTATPPYSGGSLLQFKAKGSSHANVKSRSTNPTKISNETYESIRNFVTDVLTESRLEQGIQYLQEMELPIVMQSMGTFLSWINNDVIKEESQAIVDNDFNVKLVNKEISTVAREWFKNKVNAL